MKLKTFGFLRSFQSFEATQNVDPNPGNYGNNTYNNTYYDPTAYAAPDPVYDGATSDFDNEPPLLEGEIFGRINSKTQIYRPF